MSTLAVAFVAFCLSLLPAAAPSSSNGLKIFMYDLPQWRNATEWGDISDSDYGLDQIFPDLLMASPYVTTDPDEADYFFAHAWIFWPHATLRMGELLDAIRAKWKPYLERKNASDHIFVITADQGRCQYEAANRVPHPGIQKSILLQHYGGNLHSTDFFTHPKVFLERWGGELDREIVLGDSLYAEDACDVQNVRCTLDSFGRRRPFFCHVPYQDIVVPPSVFERKPQVDCHHCHYSPKVDTAHRTPYIKEGDSIDKEMIKNRTIMLFQAGSQHFHQAEYYSIGARQSMISMFGGGRVPSFKVDDGMLGQGYWSTIAQSIFCLGTTGTGWGSRMKVGLVRGCIPVIAGDGVKVEFEEQLPLKEYAVRIPSWMWFRTPDILQMLVDTGRVKEMQENLKCAWRLHWWRRPHGRAFEVVMCELRRRKAGVVGYPGRRDDPIEIDFKACTMRCMRSEEPVSLLLPNESLG